MADSLAPSATDGDGTSRVPVSAGDVEYAVSLAIAAFRRAPADADWSAKAGALDWDCWETAEHLADDLFAYAGQIAAPTPPVTHYVPFVYTYPREGGPGNTVMVDREADPEAVFEVLEATAGMLAALVALRAPTVRGYHSYGVSDPEGFAAMGVVETLVHAYDIGAGLGVDFTPPSDLCDRTLARLFPEAPADTHRWQTLLWATGRAEIPGHDRRQGKWRWHAEPLGERQGDTPA
ncbi:maleylpyruvate isomerase N-terminal domain-containing protein [Streptodolium elevatio]|uniref:Maleylpyruvate isomerase N-terminal domain-containing protein n=1 Tax=Streptodolium elevatio TaxID=3157996 RepID=A0ABV3DHE1_9ACTN